MYLMPNQVACRTGDSSARQLIPMLPIALGEYLATMVEFRRIPSQPEAHRRTFWHHGLDLLFSSMRGTQKKCWPTYEVDLVPLRKCLKYTEDSVFTCSGDTTHVSLVVHHAHAIPPTAEEFCPRPVTGDGLDEIDIFRAWFPTIIPV